ncbi:transposable element tc1 transposase [Hirsutella rhossiliensis]|uniref:Transposable element tc1 transposase n=1 Tax=Hirsutella rhossiliensis TaxID=111463 RepID=A0A9P8N4Q7_9HYPO|nr:transposable element tc1 transposase [Hirsutella rhossiliensis]KAH0966917.1 transposable element tc1 transposase [Hirsutella rhossiliensis]
MDRRRDQKRQWTKKCFVCGKPECWSTRHSDEERPTDYAAYLTEYEGADTDEEADFDPSDPFDDEDEDQLQDVTQFLTDQAFLHQVTGEDIYADNAPKTPSNQFLIEDRYAGRFQGILPDTGAANVSTVDMDRLHVYFNNTTDELIQGETRIPIIRKWGHPWFHLNRLFKLLTRAGHEVEQQRFKFSLKDDHEFNYEILVDVMFLKSLSTKDTWEALRCLWIDTYQGPPDVVTHDAGTNFASTEFQTEAKMLGITCKEVPIEAHWSIGKVERYHGPLRRAFEIMYAELSSQADADSILQMAVKAVNDTAGPDGLVISIKDHDITVDMVNGPTTFRSTVVKPYYKDDNSPAAPAQTTEPAAQTAKREMDDIALAIKLRDDGVITTPGAPFEQSDQKEINDLIGRGVFTFELFDPTKHRGTRIFKSRLVREVKGKYIKPYEKSRLVVQGYNDDEKNTL